MKNWLNPVDSSALTDNETYENAVKELQEASEKGYIIINGKRLNIK